MSLSWLLDGVVDLIYIILRHSFIALYIMLVGFLNTMTSATYNILGCFVSTAAGVSVLRHRIQTLTSTLTGGSFVIVL